MNNASTWDEFPNGRFGDFKSPAFGMQSDPWNVGLAISVCIVFFKLKRTEVCILILLLV